MKTINKKKFLTELSKLLSFMYDEDRETAVAMYEKMFELSPDEDALISYLMSPTRQAVLIARSYDAKERKLYTQSEKGNEAALVLSDEPPRFVETIKEIFSDALDVIPDIMDAQDSDKESEPQDNADEEEEIQWVKDNAPVQDDKTAEELPVKPVQPAEYQNASDDPNSDAIEAFLRELSIDIDEINDNTSAVSEAKMEDALPSTVALKTTKEADRTSDSTQSVSSADPENVKFASDTEGLEEPDIPTDDEVIQDNCSSDDDEPKKKTGKKKDKKSHTSNEKKTDTELTADETEDNGKLKGGRLVLFLLIAIPLAALGLIIVFSIALVFLVLAGATLLMAFRTFQAAFDSFKVFADLLVVAGSGLCITAVGILLFWAFIYFVIGLPAKIINGVINLCLKICTKKEDDEK